MIKDKFELFYPVKPWKVNQSFGACDPGICEKYKELGLNGHNGIDAWAPDGYIVRAAHDGIVTFAGEDGSGGLGIVIRTEDQYMYNGLPVYFKTIYWHLKSGSIIVNAGRRVSAGDIIARADNTGLSTGSHLHFGLKPMKQGEQDWEWFNTDQNNGFKGAIDPAPFFNKFYAEDKESVISLYTLTIKLLTALLDQLQKRK